MHKRLCACGCGNRVTRKVELQHMNSLAPAVLGSQVLDLNRKLVRRKKKKTKAIGFPAPLRQRLAMENTTEIDDMDLDDNDPVSFDSSASMMMGEDLDGAIGQSRLRRSRRVAPHVEHSKLFQSTSCISQVNQNIHIDHEGPSRLTRDVSDSPHEDAMDHDHPLDGKVYGLSNLRC